MKIIGILFTTHHFVFLYSDTYGHLAVKHRKKSVINNVPVECIGGINKASELPLHPAASNRTARLFFGGTGSNRAVCRTHFLHSLHGGSQKGAHTDCYNILDFVNFQHPKTDILVFMVFDSFRDLWYNSEFRCGI